MANEGNKSLEKTGVETFTFDDNAKNFLGKKLIREILELAKILEEAEAFMVDTSISSHEIAEFLAQEGKSERIRTCFEKFAPFVSSQIETLINEGQYLNLNAEACIEKFKNKLRTSFNKVNFTGRPLLKMIFDELEFLIEFAVLEIRQNAVMLTAPRIKNIVATKDFAKSVKKNLKVEVFHLNKATTIHNGIKGHAIVTEGEVPLEIKDSNITNFIDSITISKAEKSKPFEFATITITYKEKEEIKTVLFTISLLNSQLNGWGSSTVSMQGIFMNMKEKVKTSGHYELIRTKIFEAIEDALIEGTLKTKASIAKELEIEKAKLESVRDNVAVEVATVVEELPAPARAPIKESPKPKPEKKLKEGSKQFANIKLDVAGNTLLRCEGVTEVGAWHHSGCRTFMKTVNGKPVKVNLMPYSSNKSVVNPISLKGALDTFGIAYEDFKNEL